MVLAVNATIIQPWWISLMTILAVPLSAGLGGLIAYIASKRTQEAQFHIEEMKIKKSIKDNRIQAYSDLLGCTHSLLQVKSSYLTSVISAESLVLHAKVIAIGGLDLTPVKDFVLHGETEPANSYYSEKLKIALERSFFLRDATGMRNRILDLEILVGKTDERFWKSIGRVKALFPDTRVSNLSIEIKTAEEDLEVVKNIQDSFQKIGAEINGFGSKIAAGLQSYADPDAALDMNVNQIRNEWVRKTGKELEDTSNSNGSDVKTKSRILESKNKRIT